MWESIAGLILRNRILILSMIVLVTVFMGFHGRNVKETYKFGGILPEDDSTYIEYSKFLETFGEDGNVLVIGAQGEEIFELENYAAWYQMGLDIKDLDGVDSIFSIAHLFDLRKDEVNERFFLEKINESVPTTQEEVDLTRARIDNLPFYDDLLYNDSTHAVLMMVFVNAEKFNSEARGDVMDRLFDITAVFSQNNMELRYSGLPHIRTYTAKQVKSELGKFVALAALVTAIILYLFFHSFRVVVFCLLVVGIGVIWSLGTIELMDYRLSSLSGLIPPLIIVIGIPNCVFLLNKYHKEYETHGNRIKALVRVISKIGNATFLTNVTTALGFATFIFTESDLLRQFGVVASLNIIGIFLLSLFIIPIVFSYLPEPKTRHLKHLQRRWLDTVVSTLVFWVEKRRKAVYVVTVIVLGLGVYGVTIMRTTGNIVDDLPSGDRIIQDLRFFEANFNGVMPFEVLVDTGRKGQATKDKNLKRVEEFQEVLSEYPEFSKSLSIVDAVKFAKQAFYNGQASKFSLIRGSEKGFISPYLSSGSGSEGVTGLFMDSTKQVSRISAQMADIGTDRMEEIVNDLKPKIAEIFPKDKYSVTLTGTSIVFLKGTRYLVKNLMISLALAILVIGLIMYFLFGSVRMVLISLLPNLIPLLCTAALMGYAGVPIKPSTILVFSIAFGISVDDTIHFLAKYRQELGIKGRDMKTAVIHAVKETGVSMIYTSIVLFFGFSIFISSKFGGSQAIGILASFTLLVAMLSNLVVLPSLLLSFEKLMMLRTFREPLFELLDEETDIDLDALEIRRGD
ncbi:MAG: MMPL family transporter [Flavobacteriales bacterium]|nr:MMPL family transporter [Flavobacteriales bacterium]NNK81335.1 MMPL family transporter [Flavobacteriales bacterium]